MSIFFFLFLILSLALILIFYSVSKNDFWDLGSSSGFECGFSSYFFSRLSFCVSYVVISLIFLFLDLEICVLFIFFISINSSFIFYYFLYFFVLVLLFSLFMEWLEGSLNWLV